jgi:hypothetical protein
MKQYPPDGGGRKAADRKLLPLLWDRDEDVSVLGVVEDPCSGAGT